MMRDLKKSMPLLVNAVIVYALLMLVNSCSPEEEQPPAPVITTFSPAVGLAAYEDTPGTTVTISGKNFSSNLSAIELQFNGTQATLISATKTELVARVPGEATTGKISVTVNGKTVSSVSDFAIIPQPTITTFYTSGFKGAIISIHGTNFSTTPANNEVRFNGTPALVTSATAIELQVKVPDDATNGRITVTVNNATAKTSSDFTVRVPVVFQLQPYSTPGMISFNAHQLSFIEPGFYHFKFNNVKVGEFHIGFPGPNPPNPNPKFEIVLPPSATTAKLTVERFDGIIEAISENELEILKPFPSGGLTAMYAFSNNLETFARNAGEDGSSAIHLNHRYQNKDLPVFTANRFGTNNRAISFNGNQAGTTTTDRFSGKPWTISFWINYESLPQDIFCNGGISSHFNNVGVDIAMIQRNDAVGANLNMRVIVDDNDGGTGSVAELTDYKNDPTFLPLAGTSGNWINLTLTYNGTLFRIYKNGTVVVEKTITGNKGSGIGPTLRVGNAGGFYYKGKMDDLLIYNTALSESQVLELFEQTQTKY